MRVAILIFCIQFCRLTMMDDTYSSPPSYGWFKALSRCGKDGARKAEKVQFQLKELTRY